MLVKHIVALPYQCTGPTPKTPGHGSVRPARQVRIICFGVALFLSSSRSRFNTSEERSIQEYRGLARGARVDVDRRLNILGDDTFCCVGLDASLRSLEEHDGCDKQPQLRGKHEIERHPDLWRRGGNEDQ